MANQQTWQLYVDDATLERYIALYEYMVERYENDTANKSLYNNSAAALERTREEYDRRTK